MKRFRPAIFGSAVLLASAAAAQSEDLD